MFSYSIRPGVSPSKIGSVNLPKMGKISRGEILKMGRFKVEEEALPLEEEDYSGGGAGKLVATQQVKISWMDMGYQFAWTKRKTAATSLESSYRFIEL